MNVEIWCRWCGDITGSKSRTCRHPRCQLQFAKFKTPITYEGAAIMKERIEQLRGTDHAQSAIET